MSGKRLAFAFVGGILLWANAANASYKQDINSEKAAFSEEIGYDLRKDPFLLDLAFEKRTEKKDREPAAPLTGEEKILSTWKEKQEGKWESLPRESFAINASAYTAAADECGKGDGVTSSGLKVKENRTLACPPEYPFGARISIEGVGTFRCEDRGGAIKGNKFDIYMETKKEAFAFGRKNLTAQVVFD